MADRMNFQDMILRSLDFWRKKGCLVWHPHNVQVGAGTLNPATVLRVLGPEPWNVVYLEPSIRPDDGRFGDNPNRMQQHYQLQVILQPDPGNPQELYLESLEAMGIDLKQHDIRFVEDNWQQPAFGAWGLGWEVWLDGQEITQYTYFQQAGSVSLDPVAVEITYGLDRIALALQDVDSVWQIDFGAGIDYGDLLLQSEIEHCRYYFNEADVDALRKVYDIYENEARRCVQADLVAPAHDFNLKCSFLFNVMDARGAIGVTERAHYFRRMRGVAREIAQRYLDQRQRLEYPYLEVKAWEVPAPSKAAPAPMNESHQKAQHFVLEIGCEELPAGDLASALRQLKGSVPQKLDDLRLKYDRIEIRGTPRRIVIQVHKLATRQSDQETEVKGPPADKAYDSDGNPTQAAVGFARSRGLRTEDLGFIIEGARRYVAAVVKEEGEPTSKILSQAIPELIADLKFDISMRWNASNIAFSRPIRWLLALFGNDIVPISYADIQSGRTSRGLRGSGSPIFEVAKASAYTSRAAEYGILLSGKERRAVIRTAANNLAEDIGGVVIDDPALLAEVANLVEQPTLLRGRFDDRFLRLPDIVLVAVMKQHQRYFPVYDRNKGTLLPYFITVRNGGSEHLDVVQRGNEHVIRARFTDAEFFYLKDSQHTIEEFLPRLETLTFQTELGSMREKVQRLEKITPIVADQLGLDPMEREAAVRAAALSKADLASNMVVEMTSLQGVMGGLYASMSGEPDAVTSAVAEQYEMISTTRPGLALAIADRLDSLVALFAAGMAPKGSNDPFALRRAAIQIIENLVSNEVIFDIKEALMNIRSIMPLPVEDEHIEEVLEFLGSRLNTFLQEKEVRTSVIRAITNVQRANPFSATMAAMALNKAIKKTEWPQLLDAYSRCVRITRDQPTLHFQPALGRSPEEITLYAAVEEALQKKDGSVPTLIMSLRELESSISHFFDNVLVMDEDDSIRQNRLGLLQLVASVAEGIADLSELEGF